MSVPIRTLALRARATVSVLGTQTTNAKHEALQAIADRLVHHIPFLLQENERDLHEGRQNGLSPSLLDRLTLTPARIEAMSEGIRAVIALPDPIGEIVHTMLRPNGLFIRQIRVPLGLIGMIYESRPNVTIDAIALCLKTGNAVLLRGGTAAHHSNVALVKLVHDALSSTPLPSDAVQLVTDGDRHAIDDMLRLTGVIDCVIPRGGAALIDHCVRHAHVPIIETGAGICHTYVDASADVEMAMAIACNAKVQRPSVCNAMETLLVHETFAKLHLPHLVETFQTHGVTLRGDPQAMQLVPGLSLATSENFATEYNDLILNIRVVANLEEALAHIATYGTRHSECIVTQDELHAQRFLSTVDAAVVYHNASTRFTDGFEFGFGAEIGISTQKLHARGPMGLPALTSTKYVVHGNGHIRT